MKNKKILIGICFLLFMMITACAADQPEMSLSVSSGEKTENTVPFQATSSNDTAIPCRYLKNWGKFDSKGETIYFQDFFTDTPKEQQPYVKLGESISFELDKEPDSVIISDYVLEYNGSIQHQEETLKESVDFKVDKNKVSFTLDRRLAVGGPDNIYIDGRFLRGFRVTCLFGDERIEFGLVVITDIS